MKPPALSLLALFAAGVGRGGTVVAFAPTRPSSIFRFFAWRIGEGPKWSSVEEVSWFEREAGGVIRRMYEEERGSTEPSLEMTSVVGEGEEEERGTSPYLALKKSSLVPEQNRRSEWSVGGGSPEPRGGTTTHRELPRASSRKKAKIDHSVVPASIKTCIPLSAFANQGWDASSSSPGHEKVSQGSTSSFVFGDKENSQRPQRPLRLDTSAEGVGYFKLFVGDRRTSSASSSFLKSSAVKGSLVVTEERIRPLPSTRLPEYAKVRNHRDLGDVKDPSLKSLKAAASGFSSLIAKEGRIRQVASTNIPEYVQHRDWRSVGDVRNPARSRSSAANQSLVSTEERVRPVSKNFDCGVVTVEDYRGPGDARKSSGISAASPTSLLDAEQRIRPISSSSGQHERVADRWGAGGTRSLTKHKLLESLSVTAASLSEEEQSFPPVPPSSSQSQIEQRVVDRWGSGDTRSITKERLATDLASSSPLAATASLSDRERSFRSVSPSSSRSPNDQKVADRWGPGYTRSHTMQRPATELASSSQLATTTSLSEEERSFRPVSPFSSQATNDQKVADRWGPGDTRSLTRSGSPSEAERRVPPVQSYAGIQSNVRVSDQRRPGDTNPLAATASLSDAEQEVRSRPIPSAGISTGGAGSTAVTPGSAEPASGDERWRAEKTVRPRAKQSVESSSSHVGVGVTEDKPPMAASPRRSSLQDLLNDDGRPAGNRGITTPVDGGDSATAKPPVAAKLQPSTLRELLKEERRPAGNRRSAIPIDIAAPAWQNQRSPANELEWWGE